MQSLETVSEWKIRARVQCELGTRSARRACASLSVKDLASTFGMRKGRNYASVVIVCHVVEVNTVFSPNVPVLFK